MSLKGAELSVKGYIKALIDVKNYVDSHSHEMKHYKLYNSKKLPMLLQAFIDNADEMIAMGDMIELTLTFDHKSIKKSKERYHD